MSRHTKPGGWCEFKDWDLNITSADGTLPKDSYIAQYHNLIYEALDKIQRNYAPGPRLKEWVGKAGFVGVTEEVLSVPIGMWPKERRFVRISFPQL